jgi:hypothetical protein
MLIAHEVVDWLPQQLVQLALSRLVLVLGLCMQVSVMGSTLHVRVELMVSTLLVDVVGADAVHGVLKAHNQ